MKHALTAISLCLASASMTGCTTLLSADFASDEIGSLPDVSLPGRPAGDTLSLINLGSATNSECVRVVETEFTADSTSKAVLLDSSSRGDGSRCKTMAWFASSATSANPPYTAAWQSNVSTFLDTTVAFGFNHRPSVIAVDFEGSRAILNIAGEEIEIGEFEPFEPYTALVSFNPTAGTYSVLLSGAGATLQSEGTYTHRPGMGAAGNRLGLIFTGTSIPDGPNAVDGPGSVIVGNVVMSERDPDR